MWLKFVFDRTVSFLALLLLWPVIAILALLVRIVMPDGSPFFVQTRIGRGGKPFKVIKFRTMRTDPSDPAPVPGLVAALRRYKLDELPQLWNVLTGDMSFVGPRPDLPGYADALEGEDREILALRPGITGPASLKYRDEELILAAQPDPLKYNDEVIWPDKVRINRYYLHHYSFLTDIRLILATVFRRHLTYGGEVI